MMSPLQTVWDVAESIISNPQYVTIEEQGIDLLAEMIRGFPEPKPIGCPANCQNPATTILYEMMASAINYQYWYGKHDIRINGSSSSQMYKLLDDAFDAANLPSLRGKTVFVPGVALNIFTQLLKQNRFPAIRERIAHLQELFDAGTGYLETKVKDNFHHYLLSRIENGASIEECMKLLLENFDGFAEDIFLKRASLFFMQLHRKMGWFPDIGVLPVPADYQVPKMLRYFGVLGYTINLEQDIACGRLIPEGSAQECEIRASTIIACRQIAEKSGKTACDVDNYLWSRRKECNLPFHLTITTNY